jgi:hypothetical protein
MIENEDSRTPITIQKFESIGKGKFKLKIKEHFINMKNIRVYGKDYIVTKSLARGRFIVVKYD